ncbi:MAG: short-chain dehydrogenase [Sphingobacteriales bacterium 41-5]|nr:MAG: short-chain dehydrogenase [Niabella sp. SCN 42-15]OJU27553.1 MAG: short-chain dehydrogenase [Sphingobacteriales bacterium 41-5]
MNVVVTGASRGIGFAIAEIFAQNGHHLFLTSQNEMKLYRAVETLQTKYNGVEIFAKAFDLSVKENALAFGDWCLQKAIPDVLVNNAGTYQPGNVIDEADENLEKQIATNLYSAYNLTRKIVPAMLQQKSGHIFNICSIASLKAYPGGGSYSISKFALYGFSQNLRHELMPHNIKVTAVLPGAVMTDSWGNFDNSENRIMEASDIAKIIYAATQLSPAACVEDVILKPQAGDL